MRIRLKSWRKTEEDYRTAESRFERWAVFAGTFLRSLATLGFLGFLLFELGKNVLEFPFFIFGILFSAFAVQVAIVCVRLIFLMRRDPPSAARPNPAVSVKSDGNVSSEKSSGGAGTPDEKTKLPKRILLFVFGAVFLAAGTCIAAVGIRSFFEADHAARTWREVPCKIVSAKLETKSARKGGFVYSPKVSYEYEFGGKTFRGDELSVVGSVSSSFRSREQRKLDECKARKTCWVNPENPAEAALMPPVAGFSFEKILPIILGIPFVAFGVAALFFAVRRAGTSKARDEKRQLRTKRRERSFPPRD